MTRCEHCGQSLLAYAEMRRQRDKLFETLKALRDHLADDKIVQVLNTILDKCEEEDN